MLLPHGDAAPEISPSAWVAPRAYVVGETEDIARGVLTYVERAAAHRESLRRDS
jgi:carbonic anhydrase/acetyltransferase-like protein (isoleucine patch superfamily)